MNRKYFITVVVLVIVVGASVVALSLRQKYQHPIGSLDIPHIVDSEVPHASEASSLSSSLDVKPMASEPTLENSTWGDKFRQTKDYFAFLSDAVGPATSGDGRAAYYVSQVMATCGDIPRLFKGSQSIEDARKKLADQFTQTPYMPQWKKEMEISRFNKCAKLGTENAFSALPDREGGYPYKYWKQLALDDKDSLAEAKELNNVAIGIDDLKTNDAKQEAVSKINSYIHDSILSKDPEAIFAAGQALVSVNVSKDPIRGIAVQIAACEMGYDCSANNSNLVQSNCKYTHVCPENQSYTEALQQSVSSADYAAAYEQAQVFKELLKRGDSDGLNKFLELNGRY